MEDVDGFIFSLTLRVADGLELGITTSQSGRDPVLRIEAILPGGAAEAWNRQCGSSGAAERMLLLGDKVARVNDVGDSPEAMLRECISQRLLRFLVVRSGCTAAVPATPSSARATASSTS